MAPLGLSWSKWHGGIVVWKRTPGCCKSSERALALQQGAMAVTVWSKLQAIDTMAASLRVPNIGSRQIYLLLSTIPTEWRPGNAVDAATLHGVAVSSQQLGVTEEHCKKIATWACSAEAVALWHVLSLELQDGGPFPLLREVCLGTGSVWMGDSVCLYYPMGKKRKAPAASILQVLAQDLRHRTSMRDEIAGGNKIGDYSSERHEDMAIEVIKHPGFLSRVLSCVKDGIRGDRLVHPPSPL